MFALRSSCLLPRALAVRPVLRQLHNTAVKRNVVQELYLKELKNVKLSPITAKDAEGSVKPWSEPVKPKIPELEGQGTDALKAYSSEPVETKTAAVEEEAPVEEDWLVLEDDVEDTHAH